MSWASGNKLVNSHDDGTIGSKGFTTRARTASLLMRFNQNVVER